MKRCFAIVLLVALFCSFTCMSNIAYANPAVWDGKRAIAFAKGDGSKDNPFQISNGNELAFFEYVHSNTQFIDGIEDEDHIYNNKYYVLTNDIYLNDISNYDKWEYGKTVPKNMWKNPTGLGGYAFNGHLDGQGHTIYGLYQVFMSKGGGLFYSTYPNAVIENLNMSHSLIYAVSFVGCLSGQVHGSTISNCKISGRIEGIGGDVPGGSVLGGIAGHNQGTIENCVFTGSVNNAYSGSGAEGVNVGGIAGICSSWDTLAPGKKGLITGCINYGSLKSKMGSIGGIAGSMGHSYDHTTEPGTITNCLNAGSVSGSETVGGIVGMVGYHGAGTDMVVENCISYGNVTTNGTDKTTAGAAFGSCMPGGKITNCYYDNKVTYPGLVSDQASQAGNVKGLKTTQMIGSNAVSAMKLSSKVWTNVNNYYPQIKALHDKGWTVIQSLDSGNASNAGANNSNSTGSNTASASNNSNNVNNTENNSNISTTDSGIMTSDSVQSGEDVISENNDNSAVSEENGVTSGNDKAGGNAQESGMPTGLLIAIIILAVVLVLGIVAFVIYRFHPEWLPFLKKQK